MEGSERLPSPLRYPRVIVKISGEAFSGAGEHGINEGEISWIASEIAAAYREGAQIGVVVGGGNFLRGAQVDCDGISALTGDQMGMLATLLNALALRDVLESEGVRAVAVSALEVDGVLPGYDIRKCKELLGEGRVVILGGGTGSPFFTTDTAAALRAVELGAAAVLKATKVDGVYSADPVTDPSAVRFESLSYMEVLQQRLKVMDSTAVSLCMEHDVRIVVFDYKRKGAVRDIVRGEKVGTLVRR